MLLQRWLDGEQPCKRMNDCAGVAQVFAPIEAEHVEPQSAPTKKVVRDNHGSRSEHFNERIDNLSRIAGQR